MQRSAAAKSAGLRSARVGDAAVHELRLGLTFAFSLKHE